eukprot:CAMPEP_0198126632 /NCGR_PEP_ID=MMETSP1442-20131203/45303_1 /TAXON_ID= /ORGANISM="Craspedostauros australis, Strain CCMP3328" /LENGTH=97 /DNA_ID=CAMNT_0043786451 /DNA_START=71 /DNA_END=364 /DNA_ORIENTATION=-
MRSPMREQEYSATSRYRRVDDVVARRGRIALAQQHGLPTFLAIRQVQQHGVRRCVSSIVASLGTVSVRIELRFGFGVLQEPHVAQHVQCDGVAIHVD